MFSHSTLKNILFASGVLFGSAGIAQTATPGYTKVDLDETWQRIYDSRNVGTYATTYQEGLIRAAGKLYTMTQANGTQQQAGTPMAYRISSLRLSPKIQKLMNERQIDLLDYQRKIQAFERQPVDASNPDVNKAIEERTATISELAKRKQAVALELYYINVLRYFQATTLVSKCRYLTEASINRVSALDYVSVNKATDPLAGIFADVEKSNKNEVEERLPCRLSASLGQVESKSLLQQKINDQVAESLTGGKIQTTIAKINDITAGYEALLQEIQVDPKTKELNELQRNLLNAKSNMELVSQDQLKVGPDLQDLKKVDTAGLDKIALGTGKLSHPAIEDARKKRVALYNAMKAFVAKLGSIPQAAGVDAASVDTCNDLSTSFDDMFVGTDEGSYKQEIRDLSSVKRQVFKAKLESCLKQTKTYIETLAKQSEYDAFLEEFAAKLDQLNDRVRLEKNKS